MRKCKFIQTDKGAVFVQRPTSVFGGMARHNWLKRYFKRETTIVSNDFWDLLIERHGGPKLLVEVDDKYWIEESEE